MYIPIILPTRQVLVYPGSRAESHTAFALDTRVRSYLYLKVKVKGQDH